LSRRENFDGVLIANGKNFISGLIESGVEFVAVDMPEANRLAIHILAAVAEHEREMVSQRTKAALQVAKTRGTKLGSPQPKKGAAIRSQVFREKADRFPLISYPSSMTYRNRISLAIKH